MISTNLLGMYVEWSDTSGYHRGIIVGVNEQFDLLIMESGYLRFVHYNKVVVREG